MANWSDLLSAILSLDVYNRGFGPGMKFDGNSDSIGTRIGDFTIVARADDPSVSFYALAYQWDGGTIISYRGTRFPGSPDFGDVLNGWTLSLGFGDASQAKQALNFYNLVHRTVTNGQNNIELTGHSLGQVTVTVH